ncbi:hypothetical protein [Schlesneria paludicola]|uniref:hypothetical protein n=1 Tax=Schlesneria paludicola TaxID=360056 RepID=UPI00029AF576|nr:hypothetical protein [Schlesneria paludicola]
MSKTRVVQIVVGALASVLLLVGAFANFARLQSRSEAPGLVDYLLYVASFGLLGLAALAVVIVVAVVAVLSNRAAHPSGDHSPDLTGLHAKKEPESDVFRNQLNEEFKEALAVDAKRTRIWKIIDELSDALRDDDAGSDALFIVRERFHKLQFGPTPHQATESTEDDEKPAPTKRAAS